MRVGSSALGMKVEPKLAAGLDAGD